MKKNQNTSEILPLTINDFTSAMLILNKNTSHVHARTHTHTKCLIVIFRENLSNDRRVRIFVTECDAIVVCVS